MALLTVNVSKPVINNTTAPSPKTSKLLFTKIIKRVSLKAFALFPTANNTGVVTNVLNRMYWS